MKTLRIAVACRNASGMADMPVFSVTVTEAEYLLGEHYDKAETMAAEDRYERPFVCFDTAEQGVILSAVSSLDLVPQVVAIDMTDGHIHSVRCDAGSIQVICYDTSETEELSEAVDLCPVGEGGQMVLCWAAALNADVDEGLSMARDWAKGRVQD